MNHNQRILELGFSTLVLAREMGLPTESLNEAIVLLEISMASGLETTAAQLQLAGAITNTINYFRDEFSSVIEGKK